MKSARIFVLAVALAAGGAAAFLINSNDEKKPAPAPAPVVQMPTVGGLIALGDIGMGTAVAAEDFDWQAWPVATTSDSNITKKSRPNAIEELAGSITRAPLTAGKPIREASIPCASESAPNDDAS